MEETLPELQEAPFLDKAGDRGAVCSLYFAVPLLAGRCEVFDSLVAVDDISAGAALCSAVQQCCAALSALPCSSSATRSCEALRALMW